MHTRRDERLDYLSYIKKGLGRDDPRNLLPPRVTENYITSTPRPRHRPPPNFGGVVQIPDYETMTDNKIFDIVNYPTPQVQTMISPTQPPARSFVEDIPRFAPHGTYFKRTHGTGDGTLAGIITPRKPVFRPPYMDQAEIKSVVLRHRPRYSRARRSLTGNELATTAVNNLNPLHTPFSRSIRPTDVTEPAEMYAAVKNQLNHIDRRRRSRDQEIALKKGYISEQKEDLQQKLYERLNQQYDQRLFDDAPLSSRRSDGSVYSYTELPADHDISFDEYYSEEPVYQPQLDIVPQSSVARRSDGSEYSYTELSPRPDQRSSLDQSFPEQRSFIGPVYNVPPWSQYDHR
ncbi:hypothetical protein EXVG_00215 [Emiliania huxleyi virus 202]|nr:hypothetical protein EXVG_00215 [Emiliania huxleyi virus 202]AHA54167.1 hypothetical protein EhV18_00120 [Emiliania huxleyi virus 18]AHA55213.1 hypothetical protein EhV156_00116 [Emiliania huxleyi virus 156]